MSASITAARPTAGGSSRSPCGDAFAAADEAELLAGRRLDGDAAERQRRRSRRCARASRRGAARSAAPRTTIVMSRWAMRPPRACTRSTAKARNRSEEAPRHCGSLGGKCAPMSPSASAPRIASVSACSATSASEWPVSAARRAGCARRRAMTWSPSREGVHVEAVPVRTSPSAPAQARLRRAAKSSAVVSLMLPLLALEHRHRHAGPFGQRGIVGEIVAARRGGAAMRGEQRREGEGLRRLHGAQIALRSSVAITRPSSSTCLTVSVTGSAGTAAPCVGAAAIARATSAAETNGRAASWTSTIRGRSAASASSPARTEAWRVAPPSTGGSRSSPSVAAAKRAASSAWMTGWHDVDRRMRREGARLCAHDRLHRRVRGTAWACRRRRAVPRPAATTMRATRSPLSCPDLHRGRMALARSVHASANRILRLLSVEKCCSAALARRTQIG